MKHTLNKFWLLWLCLLLSIFILKSVNAADDATVTIDPTAPAKVWYRSTLHTLNLWSLTNFATLQESNWRMRFTNWLVAWKDSSVWNSQYAVIGWWDGNKILNNANYAGIWWWKSNEIRGNYAVIGWWAENDANWDNSVVVGGYKNTASAQNSVVVGGYNNTASGQNSVVVGGQNNKANKNSLALGHNATANEWAFAWNWSAWQNSAYISASNWTLIGTITPIAWVNLVVDGAVRVAWTKDNGNKQKWEIRYVSGCFYWYDGSVRHILNRGTEKTENDDDNDNNKCKGFDTNSVAQHCEFGNTILWDWDKATGYKNPYSTNCNATTNKKTVTCVNWSLSPSWYTYPYCYPIHAN